MTAAAGRLRSATVPAYEFEHPYYRLRVKAPYSKPDSEGERCAFAVIRARRLVWNRERARDDATDVAQSAVTNPYECRQALGRARYRRNLVVRLLEDRESDE